MELLKSSLNQNKWVFDILSEPIKSKMSETLNLIDSNKEFSAKEVSTTFLTTSIYKPGRLPLQLSQKKPKTLELISDHSANANCLNPLITHIFKSGNLVKSNPVIQKSGDWVSEFLEFCNRNSDYKSVTDFIEYAILVENVPFRGASHPHLLSSIFLQLRPSDSKFDFMVSIIHESAHQELFLINFVDRLVSSGFDYNLIHAPYQNKIRPPIGRLHSLHALYRMIQFAMNFAPDNSQLTFLRSKFNENLDSFEEGELTEFARFLLGGVYEPFSKSF